MTMAEMHYDQGLPNRVERADIGPDDMHPTDKGYFKMGDIFMEKILEVEKNGWLKRPVDNGVPADGEAARDAEDAIKEQEERLKEKQDAEPGKTLPGRRIRRAFRGRHAAAPV